jgi:hypothetical protein
MPAPGVSAQVLDVNAPARAVTEDKVGAHGSYDLTRYRSAAAVALSMILFPDTASGQTPELFLDALGPLLDPALRPTLIVTNDQWTTQRQLTVRFDSTTKPLSDPTNWPVQVSWQAPVAAWESTTLVNLFANALLQSTTGITIGTTGLPITIAGIVMPATSAPSPSQVTSIGSTVSQWTALLYGPCTGPKLANDTTGLTLEFTDDVTLSAGDYVTLDSSTRTATLNSNQSILPFLSFSTSDWWLIQPGLNTIRFYPTAAGGGSQAQLTFRPAWPA